MKKYLMSFAAVAAMLLVASCGNKSANANGGAESGDSVETATTAAAAEVAYEQFKVEKFNVTADVPKGLRRTDNPVMDNGANFTMVPEDDDDFPIYAAVQIGVYESMFGNYDDARIKKDFEESVPKEAVKNLDLENKEYTYSLESETINEYHRVVFKDNKYISVLVSYTKRWEDKLGGEVRDHILNSAKFN